MMIQGTAMKWYVCYDDEPQKRLVRLPGLSSLARHKGLRHMHEGEEGSRIVTIGLQQVLDVHEGGAFLQRLAGQVVDVLAAGLEAQVKALDVRSQVELLLVVGTVRPDAQVEGSEVAELRQFDKIALNPGETRTVTLQLPVSDLAFVGYDGRWRLEQGDFLLTIGSLSTQVTCDQTFIWEGLK